MLGLTLQAPSDRPIRVVAVGAHSDDIEIGAGGTLLRLIAEAPSLDVRWIVLSAEGDRATEARASAERMLAGVATKSVEIETFQERYFPYLPALKDRFVALGSEPPPDLVLSPRTDDLHQDHRTVAELIRQTFRDQLILEYEIPKFEGDLGQPNVFVELDASVVEAKLAHLTAMFGSQRSRTWFRDDVFRGLLAIRGVEGGTASGFAEGFTARKVRLGPGALGAA